MYTRRLRPVLLRLAAVALVCGGTAELRAETPSGPSAVRQSGPAPHREIRAAAADNPQPVPGTPKSVTSTTLNVENTSSTVTGASGTGVSTAVSVTAASSANSSATHRPQRRREHLAGRNRSQHTLFVNAGYTAIISTLYLSESSSGSLNEGLDIWAGYNWTSRRGFGAGILYSGTFISAEREGFTRRSRLHYIAPEFVARQRVGRRWLFRESAGIGVGGYIRSYRDLQGSRWGVGIHETVSAEYMLTRHLGLAASFGAQWLIVGSPDVDDGWELSLAGIFRFQFGGGLRFYF